MKRTIAVVTSSRADYSHLYWPLMGLHTHPDVELKLIVMAAHLSPQLGSTVEEIECDGLTIAARIECLLSSDTDTGMAKTIGLAVLSLSDTLSQMRPDLLLLIADRYEMLAPACAALALRIPIAHIEGGEISEGAIDDAVRNAISKMSHIHFTSTETARARLVAMGEESWRVHRAGAPSLDHLERSALPSRGELETIVNLDLSLPTLLVAYHPVTLMRNTTEEADALFAAIAQTSEQVIFCYPNADAGSHALIARCRSLAEARDNTRVLVNLAAPVYWGLLRSVTMLIGNSSSGIMETASFGLPTVNVGMRQQGRERAANVIDVRPEREAILAGIARAGSEEFRTSLMGMQNPYGDGCASERIVHVLTTVPVGEELLIKRGDPLRR